MAEKRRGEMRCTCVPVTISILGDGSGRFVARWTAFLIFLLEGIRGIPSVT